MILVQVDAQARINANKKGRVAPAFFRLPINYLAGAASALGAFFAFFAL